MVAGRGRWATAGIVVPDVDEALRFTAPQHTELLTVENRPCHAGPMLYTQQAAREVEARGAHWRGLYPA